MVVAVMTTERPRFRIVSMLAAMGMMVTLATTAARTQPACEQPDEIGVMAVASSFGEVTTAITESTGLFRKHCLAARVVPVDSTSAGFARVLTSTIDFAESTVGELLLARTKDLKLRAVVAVSEGVPYALVVRSGVSAVKDLAGKKVGVSRLGAEPHRFAAVLFAGARVEPAAYVPGGPMPEQLAALERGAVDAALLAEPAADLAVAAGYATIAVDLRTPGTGPPAVQRVQGTFHVKVTSEVTLRDRPDVVRRYVLASEEAARWIRDPANVDQVMKHVRATVKPGRETPEADRVFPLIAKRYAGSISTSISRRSVDAWLAFERAAGQLKTRVAFDDAVWSGAPVSE